MHWMFWSRIFFQERGKETTAECNVITFTCILIYALFDPRKKKGTKSSTSAAFSDLHLFYLSPIHIKTTLPPWSSEEDKICKSLLTVTSLPCIPEILPDLFCSSRASSTFPRLRCCAKELLASSTFWRRFRTRSWAFNSSFFSFSSLFSF